MSWALSALNRSRMMSIHTDPGSLYDEGVRSFHKHRPNNGLYQSEDSKLLFADRLTTPDTAALSTPDVTSLLTGVESSLITSQAPTPTRFLRGEVTTEQEMYAKGFLEALDDLQTNRQPEAVAPSDHKLVTSSSRMDVSMPRTMVHHSTQDMASASSSVFLSGPNPSLEAVAPTYVNATMSYIPNLAPPSHSESSRVYALSHSSYPPNTYSPPVVNHFAPVLDTGYDGYSSPPLNAHMQSSMGNSLPPQMMKEIQRVVPADIKTQEHMKVERKKARNRIAASKCRLRRLQRESDLQGKVRVLKEHNQELNNEVNGLKIQISNLKKALIQHMKGGCEVNLPEGYHGLRTDSTSE